MVKKREEFKRFEKEAAFDETKKLMMGMLIGLVVCVLFDAGGRLSSIVL